MILIFTINNSSSIVAIREEEEVDLVLVHVEGDIEEGDGLLVLVVLDGVDVDGEVVDVPTGVEDAVSNLTKMEQGGVWG
jgi:hypothetical protein